MRQPMPMRNAMPMRNPIAAAIALLGRDDSLLPPTAKDLPADDSLPQGRHSQLPGQDSNLELGSQSPLCYRYTTG